MFSPAWAQTLAGPSTTGTKPPRATVMLPAVEVSPQSPPTINLACKLGHLVAANPLLLPKELLPATTSSAGDARAMST